jgi:hypothetical protein
MKRTVTALYETPEAAERARDGLLAVHLCKEADVEICDEAHEEGKRHHSGLAGWLGDMFGGHSDHHLYAEGLRRGHFLLIAKVDDLNETRAAVIMDAAAVNLAAVETKWREEGWTPETAGTHHHAAPFETGGSGGARGPYASTPGSGVRAYTL